MDFIKCEHLNAQPDSNASHLNKEQKLLFRSVVCLFSRLNKQNEIRFFSSSVNLELNRDLEAGK